MSQTTNNPIMGDNTQPGKTFTQEEVNRIVQVSPSRKNRQQKALKNGMNHSYA